VVIAICVKCRKPVSDSLGRYKDICGCDWKKSKKELKK